ncbi:MAG: MFS transporter, partial [Chloroflexi bacterium]|nr:MFS transporter [Chloroflexota bacterium]
MPLISERLLQTFASMQQRDFRYLTFSTGSLGFAQWFQQIGQGWLVLEVTHSAGQVGVITFLRGITILLASPPAGVLSDRYSRRNVIVWTTFASVVQALALAALVFANMIESWHLWVFAIAGGLTQAVTQPARQAFVYDVTERELLTNALTVNSLAQNLARVSGPPLAGAIIGLLGNASLFLVLAVLNVVAMGLTMLIRTRGQVAAANRVKES